MRQVRPKRDLSTTQAKGWQKNSQHHAYVRRYRQVFGPQDDAHSETAVVLVALLLIAWID